MTGVIQSRDPETNGRWVLKNTFIEVVEESGGDSRNMVRASSDSVLYEGCQQRQREEEARAREKTEPAAEEGDMEFELTGWSDTETDPGTKEGEKSLPLPCYSHIQDNLPSGESTPAGFDQGEKEEHDDYKNGAFTPSPRSADQHVVFTPSPRGMDWNNRDGECAEVEDEVVHEPEVRTDPLPDVLPPRRGADDVSSLASKEDLQQLAAEVARLAQENELLRQRFLEKETRSEERRQPTVEPSSSASWWVPVSGGAVPVPVAYFPGTQQHLHQEQPHQWASAQQVQPGQQGLPGQHQAQQEAQRSGKKGASREEAPLNDSATLARGRRRSSGQKGVEAAVEALEQGKQKGRGGSKTRGSEAASKGMECDLPPEQCTTVMLRNLPNNYSREMLLAMLDGEDFLGQYNFLYLPIDFQSRACLGYAFVNLVDPSVVPHFWATFSGYTKWVLPSKKVCGVSWSGPHQGLEAHVDRYRNSPVMHLSVPDEYKPVIFDNGVRVPFPEPSKVPRPPRVRNHVDFKAREVHWSVASQQQKLQGKQSSRAAAEPARMPVAVGALAPGSVSRA